MEIWQRAKSFAEEAAKRSQTLTASSSFKISDIVTETAKRSKDFAAEASKKADELRSVALKSFSDQIPTLVTSSHSDSDFEKFGVTDDLREFVKGLTLITFQNFPVQDELPVSDVPTFSNVQQDLSEWQQKHATLVLTTVQEISKLRYELCPRLMKERKFWKIYFTLVNSHVAPYEKQYMEEVKQKEAEQSPIVGETNKSEPMGTNLKSRTSTSSAAEQDLDTFLLGDLEDSDGGPDDDDDEDDKNFDDDFDKIDSSDVEDEKQLK